MQEMVEIKSKKHARFGIASAVLSPLVIPALVYIAYLGYSFIKSDTWGYDFTLLSRISSYSLLFSSFTLLLGIIGLFEKDRKKLLALIGIAFSILFLIIDMGMSFILLALSMPL